LGQKVNPIGFRLGISRTWDSKWFAEKDYAKNVGEDLAIRDFVKRRLTNAGVSRVEIERASQQLTVTVSTARPGVVIGKNGTAVEEYRQTLESMTSKRVRLNVLEIRQSELDATLVARNIAEQLEKRVAFRRAMKQSVQRTMRAGAKGVRMVVAGRLGGNEMASRSKEIAGSVPLHTLRAYIDYGFAEAKTTFGMIGVKVWIYRGDVIEGKAGPDPIALPAGANRGRAGAPARGDRARPGGRSGRAQTVTPRQTDSSSAPAEEAINRAAVGSTDDQQHES
jgi:small subunit ribosomal protein S3